MSAPVKTFLNNSPPQCDDTDLNAYENELNDAINTTNQTPDPTDHTQTSITIATYGSQGYTDTGSINAFNLMPQTIGSGTAMASPVDYFNLMPITFIAGNGNTSACTVNVNGLGVKNLYDQNGNALTGGEILEGQIVSARYNSNLSTHGFVLENGLSQNNPIGVKNGLQVSCGDSNTFIISPGSASMVSPTIGSTSIIASVTSNTNIVKAFNAGELWTPGEGGNLLLTTFIGTAGWFYVFIISNSNGSVFDYAVDTTYNCTHLSTATGFTLYRRIGIFYINSDPLIIPFFYSDNNFYCSQLQSANAGYLGVVNYNTTYTNPAINIGPYLPPNIDLSANLNAYAKTTDSLASELGLILQVYSTKDGSFNSNLGNPGQIYSTVYNQFQFPVGIPSSATLLANNGGTRVNWGTGTRDIIFCVLNLGDDANIQVGAGVINLIDNFTDF